MSATAHDITTAVHVVMGVDEGYAIPLAVALASLDASCSGERVVVHILHPGFSEATQQRLAAPLTTVELDWIGVDHARLAGAAYSSFLSVGSLYRLLSGELLPTELERVLYLDADILVRGALADLYRTDLDGHVVGAVRDAGTPWAACLLGAPWREWDIDPATPYFNSGVLLIDLAKWRAEGIGARCIDLLRAFTPRWGDQDALNAVIGGAWHELPRRWNLQTPVVTGDSADWALWREDAEAALSQPSIVHYTGLEKPWHYGARHAFAPEWLEWLTRTGWSDWRPVEHKTSRTWRLARTALDRARAMSRARRRNDLAKSLGSGG